eukprot:TRINITY_DN13392_c0_g2_i1.p1 TRINITY_DN13392_c0_g2~~TRINITY_DN13392_c0_g2_i1.p1  ORF type:complete len:1716 (+),score=301.90 TRINITY_DN13392_c0_g2_i1:35-5182(+)
MPAHSAGAEPPGSGLEDINDDDDDGSGQEGLAANELQVESASPSPVSADSPLKRRTSETLSPALDRALAISSSGQSKGSANQLVRNATAGVQAVLTEAARLKGGLGSATAKTQAVLTNASKALVDEISGCPVTRSNMAPLLGGADAEQKRVAKRGVFFRQAALFGDAREPAPPGEQHRSSGSRASANPKRGRAGDFMQRLDVLLATVDSAYAVATELYAQFEGDLNRLPGLLQLLEDRWGFPTRVFPLLWTHLRKADGRGDEPGRVVSKDAWATAFVHWLQALRTRCGHAKVSRQCLVHTRQGDEWRKVYLQGAKLGEGSYGEVFLALHASLGVARVVKSVPKSQLSVAAEEVEDEVNTLKLLDHPHIVRVFEAFESSDTLHIVMDYAEGGDLASVLREVGDAEAQLPDRWVKETVSQVASALDYMHSRGVIHCDLKPGNTMLLQPFKLEDAMIEPHILLADFGLAEIFDEQAGAGGPANVKGSPAYLSPEGFEGKLTQKSDTWALGVMLYEMILGTRPFKGTSNVFLLFCQVANTEPPWEEFADEPRSLIRALMAKDPAVRIPARAVFDFPWIASLTQEEPSASLQILQTLGHAGYFHRAVMFCMASGLGMKDMSDITKLFHLMDVDHSGQLTLEELKGGLNRVGIQQDANALMSLMDLDQDGRISYTEFLAAALRLEEERGDRLMRYAFSMFDLDGDGYIDMQELKQLLSGDGPPADVLPDGRTIEQVMDEVSRGEGFISFDHFRTYLLKGAKRQRDSSRTVFGKSGNAAGQLQDTDKGDSDQMYASVMIQSLLDDGQPEEQASDTSGEENDANGDGRSRLMNSTVVDEEDNQLLFGFHDWLHDLFQDSQQDARLTVLLSFRDVRIEAAYVAHYLPATLRQTQLLTLLVIGYSFWTLTTHKWTWNPTLARWSSHVQALNNTGWLVIALASLIVLATSQCWLESWKRRKREKLGRGSSGSSIENKIARDEAVQAEESFDREAVRAERILSVWTAVMPWIACFLANRRRLSALFSVMPLDHFPGVNSDYDLIITMLGTLMFFSMRTNLCFVHTLPMALSCLTAYGCSSLIMYFSNQEMGNRSSCAEQSGTVWMTLVLMTSFALCLSGHRNLEYHRRLAFLSLYASYGVLKDMDMEHPDMVPLTTPNSAMPPTPTSNTATCAKAMEGQTRMARLKRGLEVLQRLSCNPALGNQALRNALFGLQDVLQTTRDDVAQAERLLLLDLSEKMDKEGICGESQKLVLDTFDAPPALPRPTRGPAMLSQHMPASVDASKSEAWGWQVLTLSKSSSPSGISGKVDSRRPLAVAGEELLLPAAREFVGGADGPGKNLLDALLEIHRSSAFGAEQRAALGLRASHWLAQQIGLWPVMSACERLALLTAAAGLHSAPTGAVKALGFHRCVFGALAGRDPLLGHASSAASTMLALRNAGLANAGAQSSNDGEGQLLEFVRRLQGRARPACALEDLKRLRALLESDDDILSSAASTRSAWPEDGSAKLDESRSQDKEDSESIAMGRRMLLCGLVLAAGDLAFLGLPREMHLSWAEISRQASEAGLHASSWLRGMAILLAVPLYESLCALEKASNPESSKLALAVPLRHLSENARHWKAHPCAPPSSPKMTMHSQSLHSDSGAEEDSQQQLLRGAAVAKSPEAVLQNTMASMVSLPGQVVAEPSSRKAKGFPEHHSPTPSSARPQSEEDLPVHEKNSITSDADSHACSS